MIQDFWLLLLPVAAVSGWVAAVKSHKSSKDSKKSSVFSQHYLAGLNYLLNEEPDKALDFFIKMIDVDSDIVETHLALGNLFRRRGEVNRAIRIHQNLIARPNLSDEVRLQALMSLAKDYLSAGVLDRAEKLFLELSDLEDHNVQSLQCLLDIYQQEKDWVKAIVIAQKIAQLSDVDMKVTISHHYCELAELAIKNSEFDQAVKYLKKAFSTNKHSVRASLLFANLEMDRGHFKQAIRYLKRIKEQDADYFSEAVSPLAKAYSALSKEKELVFYFKNVLQEFPKIPIVIILSEQIRQWRGDKVAANFVADYVRKHPSIMGVHRLVELHLSLTDGKARDDLQILHGLIGKLLKDQPHYQCVHCGFSGKTLHWQCPSCKKWSVVKPTHTLEESMK